ncbi:hypothetical protein [Desulforhopalus sp. IMCC35007]|uniref:hypothetical protein n=1 Tax=Desulforhopalus sp. IMCC35007 TaxID=2569543 RepID=UPI0010AE19FB|nr:hypothetical protein [Desulforhopalus sp. IMCC35007]TKB05669.1 hypothetical protein FCL48_24110 [Desulforhopalus sp. IMCC35007]
MKISSIDSKNSITIERKGDNDYSTFEVTAEIDIVHGTFTGKNIDIIFFNIDEFIMEYDSFLTNRKISPILNGTYDSYIKIEAGKGSSVFVSFSLGDAFSGYNETVDFSLNGKFEINTEFLNTIYRELRGLAENV